jgi:transcriptional regulator with GAF, ATPase, and Fis domain
VKDSNPFDESYYFRQAALRICGDLHIERSLQECLKFVCDYIPADQMNLNFLDRKARAVLLYAMATPQKALTPNMRIPLLTDDKWIIDDIEKMPKIVIENDPEPHSLAGRYLTAIGRSDASLVSMLLRAGGKAVGVVQVLARGKNRYQEEHSRRLSLLHEPFAIALSNSRLFSNTVQLKDKLIDDNQYLNKELSQISGETIIGENGGLKNQIKLAMQVANLNSPVLILGETGTGKEVLARAIHNWSGRHNNPFIKVNCGAIPQSLMDSELFGHEKGAFTGAASMRRGRFERAHHGTILLDEVGELTAEAQVRLLRVLQEKEIDRVGGYQTIRIDVRIIATTHRDLEKMVDNGSFREDLYYRLNVFPIRLPPLRERKGDIEALLSYFMKKKSTDMGRNKLLSIPKGAVEGLSLAR